MSLLSFLVTIQVNNSSYPQKETIVQMLLEQDSCSRILVSTWAVRIFPIYLNPHIDIDRHMPTAQNIYVLFECKCSDKTLQHFNLLGF